MIFRWLPHGNPISLAGPDGDQLPPSASDELWPTSSHEWSRRTHVVRRMAAEDLAAHLVIRERRPDAGRAS